MMKVHVNLATDKTAGVSTHQWGFPLPILMAFLPSFEMLVPMERGQPWNALTSTVKHRGENIVQEAHDCGRLIQDVTLVPSNAFYATIWPNSSRTMAYAASTVIMQGKATACADLAASFPLTMMSCGDPITSPLGLPLTNAHNTVFVGMTDVDLLAGILGILATIVADLIALLVSLLPEPESKILNAFLKALGLVGGISGLAKWLLGAGVGIYVGYRRWEDGGRKGPIVITLPALDPVIGPTTINYDPAAGTPTVQPTPLPTASSPSPAATSFSPLNAACPADEDWGHPLEPPDDGPGWAYNPEKGWVRP